MVEEEQSAGCVQDLTEFKAKVTAEVVSKTKFYKDFPRPGVTFMDLFSITQDPPYFRRVLDAFKQVIEFEVGRPGEAFNIIIGLEARGFVLGPMIALEWGLPFAAIRKSGKLPGETIKSSYEKEYGGDVVEIQKGILSADSKVLLVDDLLATGGTLNAAGELIRKCDGARVAASAVIFEIEGLKGRQKLTMNCSSVVLLKD